MTNRDMLYGELAEYYDRFYSKKKYINEVDILTKLITKYKKSTGKELLDVACGTGGHLEYFRNSFNCTGIDISSDMLKWARKKLNDIELKKMDMLNLQLNKKFDIITCLFSSIGHLKTYNSLKITLKNFSEHLKKGV